MMKHKHPYLLLLVLLPLSESLAIPPPDFLISGIQSLMQVLGIAAAFLVSGFFLLKDTLKLWWELHRIRLIIFVIIILLLTVLLSLWSLNLI